MVPRRTGLGQPPVAREMNSVEDELGTSNSVENITASCRRSLTLFSEEDTGTFTWIPVNKGNKGDEE